MKKGKIRASTQAVARPSGQRGEKPERKHAVSPEEIERRAYDLYLLRGGAAGSALEDWLQAERDLRRNS